MPTIQTSLHGKQDRIFVRATDGASVLVVADGAGGMGGGAEAAELLVRLIEKELLPVLNSVTAGYLVDFLLHCDHQLLINASAGEATGIIIVIKDDCLLGASVGDSEAWGVDSESIDDLTQYQRYKPLLGSGRALPVSFERNTVAESIIVATDGLFKYAKALDIAQYVRNAEESFLMDELLNLVRLPSGGYADDIGIVVYSDG